MVNFCAKSQHSIILESLLYLQKLFLEVGYSASSVVLETLSSLAHKLGFFRFYEFSFQMIILGHHLRGNKNWTREEGYQSRTGLLF